MVFKITLKEGRYSVVLTNPPFGKGLVINKSDAKFANLEICKHTKTGKKSLEFADKTELGIAFVERSWRLLQNGGRLGIILPETYFFSKSYSWFREWIDEHFISRAALNVPMEAFQGFCRAKTKDLKEMCPFCAELKERQDNISFEDLMNEWDYLNNLILGDPERITNSTKLRFWWICKNNPEHRYRMAIVDKIANVKRSIEPCIFCKGRRRKREHFVPNRKI